MATLRDAKPRALQACARRPRHNHRVSPLTNFASADERGPKLDVSPRRAPQTVRGTGPSSSCATHKPWNARTFKNERSPFNRLTRNGRRDADRSDGAAFPCGTTVRGRE